MAAQIDHFVVLMLENRSFDHIFGYREGANGLKGTETNLLNPSLPQGATNPAIKVSNAEPYSISAGKGPSHSFNAVTTQIYGTKSQPSNAAGKNNGFVKSYRESLSEDHVANPTSDQLRVVMEAFAPGTLPALEALADAFCLCDRWFCEVPGPTMPNRMFIHMGSSGGYVHNVWNHKFTNKTIYDLLDSNGKNWATYDFDQNEVRQFPSLKAKTSSFKTFEGDFAKDVRSASLPNYSFLIPRFFAKTGPVNSMHGPYDVRPADELVANVYNTIRSNLAVWKKSALIVTMDEHGGFFDHVVPPALDKQSLDAFSSPPPGDTASWVPKFKFDRLGMRVPTVIASPWVASGKIDSTEYRHTSVLATVIKMFGLRGTLTNRVKTAATFESIFSEPTARTDTPSTIGTASKIPSPRTFASGTTLDQPEYGLDAMQHEMVQGVDDLTRPQGSEPLALGNHPDTQSAASDFINARNGRTKAKSGRGRNK
jgi:phospholipase C